MKRRARTGGKKNKERRRKTPTAKRRAAPAVARSRHPSNVDLQEQLDHSRRELKEAREQQTATSAVLKVISSSPGELELVFRALLQNAVHICEAKFGNLFLYENNTFRVGAQQNAPHAYAERWRKHPVLTVGESPNNPLDRLAKTRSVVNIADLKAEPGYLKRYPRFVALVEAAGARTHLLVPMLKENELVGGIAIYRQEVRPFTDKQIELVQNFANQAVIAIENTRLLNELRRRTNDLSESLEQQTATSEVLQVISSSPGDLAPVFNSILVNARRICEAKFAHLMLYDGELFHPSAMEGAPPAFVTEFWRGPQALSAATGPGRAVATKQVVHIPDMQETEAYKKRDPQFVAMTELTGARAVLVVPMLKDDRVIGTFSTYRQEARPFTGKQIELGRNFAAQAVIAIENTRLLKELRESLQQQTATADVLKVISRSAFDLQTVLDTLAESACRLCRAERTAIRIAKDGLFHNVADYGFEPSHRERMRNEPVKPGEGSMAGRVALRRAPVHLIDAQADPDAGLAGRSRSGGVRSMLGVPLMREGAPIGVLLLQRSVVQPFTDKQIELATTFADQAVIAIQNVRLFEDVQKRTAELAEALEQQTATSEVLKVISSSPGDLSPVFDALLSNALHICEAKFGNLLLVEGDAVRMAANKNAPEAYVAMYAKGPLRPGPDTAVGRVIRTKAITQINDIVADAKALHDPLRIATTEILKARTLLAVPMLKDDELIGVLVALPPGGTAVHAEPDRAVTELRRASRHRHREHAAAQRAAPAHR